MGTLKLMNSYKACHCCVRPLCVITAWRYTYTSCQAVTPLYQNEVIERNMCSDSLSTAWQFVWRFVDLTDHWIMPDYFVCSGGFMLTVVPQKDEEVAEVIDFREVAPLAATKDMFHGDEQLARWVRIQNFTFSEHCTCRLHWKLHWLCWVYQTGFIMLLEYLSTLIFSSNA